MEACWQFWLQSLPKDTSVSVVAEVLCLKEWAHAKWWFEKTKTNWENPKVWASSSNQGQLVSGLRFTRNFEIGPGHAAQGSTGIWYENSYTIQVAKFESQPIDQGEWLPREQECLPKEQENFNWKGFPECVRSKSDSWSISLQKSDDLLLENA